jgi:hypothetical protein
MEVADVAIVWLENVLEGANLMVRLAIMIQQYPLEGHACHWVTRESVATKKDNLSLTDCSIVTNI